MFDLFGIRRRRQERYEAALATAADERRAYQERKSSIEKFLESYHEKLRCETYARYKNRCKQDDIHNTTCPACGSHNVIKHIIRQKGEIHGSGSVSGRSSGGLFWSSDSIYGTSKIDGELDTLPVNKCNDCGNEWNVRSTLYSDCESDDFFSVYKKYRCPQHLYDIILEFINMQYNPFDKTEECNSLEEKKTEYLKQIHKSYAYKNILEFYRTLPRYMVEYALYKAIKDEYYSYGTHLDPVFELDDVEDSDKFSYRVSDELWNTIRYILNFDSKSV